MFMIGVVSLFPELIDPVVETGVIGRGRERGLLDIAHASPREFAKDAHRSVDDRPYGGGPGMVLRYEPMRDAIRELRSRLPRGCPEFVLSAQGRRFEQGLARELASGPGVLLVAGRYEGMDERIVTNEVTEEISLGDYVLSGGELAAAVMIDVVGRLLPGVLGHEDSAEEDSHMRGLLGCPQYTRPESVDGIDVPGVLLGGNHEAVRRWRLKQALGRTWSRRPDLLESRPLTSEEQALLEEFRADAKEAARD